jgi:hypothetical protein
MRSVQAALLTLVVVVVVVIIGWLWRRPEVKWAPSSGGADLSVQLPDRVHYQQGDPRWSDDTLGAIENNGSLGGYGCTVASVAMAMTNLGHPTDPGKLNADLAAGGGFTKRGWLMWDKISNLTNGALRAEVYDAPSLEAMDACLMRGDYPIVKFMIGIGKVMPHWVVLVGKQGKTYLIRDPMSKEAEPVPLTQRTPVVLSVRCVGQSQL